jgi:hypothetical protein
VHTITNIPKKGLIEGPFVFERNGIYYLTYPHVQNNIERLEYATSTGPMGPYEWKGVILDESESGCWTVHHSIVEYKGQWYLFYHDRDLSPEFDKNRAIHADKLFFNDDGTIRKVIPTLRGVGIVSAKSKIQIDRYSAISGENVSVSFLDATNRFGGWKISLDGSGAWVRFNQVDFGTGGLNSVGVRSNSSSGGQIEIRLDRMDGPLLAQVQIGESSEWNILKSKTVSAPSGVHDIFIVQKGNKAVELDWVRFE